MQSNTVYKSETPHDFLLIFIHIGNTGGLSAISAINRQYQPKEKLEGLKTLQIATQTLQELPPEQIQSLRFISEHGAQFGLDKLISKECRYLTFLRDPVDRTISSYYFIKNKAKKSPYHEKINSGELSLEQFTELTANYQTLRLRPFNQRTQPLSEEEIPHFKEVLESQFCFVGVTGLFDESLFLLKHKLGWEIPPYWITLGVNGNRPKKEELPPEIIEKIEACNKIDRILYQHAKEIVLHEVSELNPKGKASLNLYAQNEELFRNLKVNLPGINDDFIIYLLEGWGDQVALAGSDTDSDPILSLLSTFACPISGNLPFGQNSAGTATLLSNEDLDTARKADKILVVPRQGHPIAVALNELGIEKEKILLVWNS